MTLGLTVLLVGLSAFPANARPRSVLRDRKPVSKSKVAEKKSESESGKSIGSSREKKAKATKAATPALALANMIYFEMSQGLHDYSTEVIETSTDARTKDVTTVRKNLYYLSPATTLTLKDGIAVNYLDADLFRRFLDGVDLAFAGEEVINGVPCLIVKSTPREGAFRENVKYYFVAKDDYRKIRIKAIKTANQKKFWFINDFTYKLVGGKYLLPLKTEGQLLTWEEIPVTMTQATFTRYKLNSGLEDNFFLPFLKDMKIDDTFKN